MAVELVVDLVEQPDVLADAVLRDLAGDHEHGGGRRVGGAEAGGGVEEPGPGHHERGAEAAARPRVAVRHVAGRLLVTRHHEANAGLVSQRGEHAVELHAGRSRRVPC